MKALVLFLFSILCILSLCVAEDLYFINRQLHSKSKKLEIESKSPLHETWSKRTSDQSSISILKYNREYQYDKKMKFSTPSNKRDVKNFVPTFVGNVKLKPNILSWKSHCFYNNTAHIELIKKPSSDELELKVILETSAPRHWYCSDWYLLASRETIHFKAIFFHGKHELILQNFLEGELQDLQLNGVRLFQFEDGVLGSMLDVVSGAKLLYGIYFQKDKLKFFEQNMNITLIDRPNKITIVNESDIHSGDFIGRVIYDGEDGLIMYGTGGRIGHATMALWFPEGNSKQLYIIESTDVGIIRTPYRKWISEADLYTQTIVWLPLSRENIQKFNETAAILEFKKYEGFPYGYENFVETWIDTLHGNYPTPLDEELISAFVTVMDAFFPSAVNLAFVQTLNQKFAYYFHYTGSPCQNMSCIFELCDKYNVTVADLLMKVERDDFIYTTAKPYGRRQVCSAFVTTIYRAAGIFEPHVAANLNSGEFTPKDVYQLRIFNEEYMKDPTLRPSICQVNPLDKNPYCVMIGRWYWDLPYYNTIVPYAHMNEQCECMPPMYERMPLQC